ncbi:MAG: hypothetical protein E7418_02165 [Ruminococcaceae bacterium]|nr:hypothetical protein [Oscillospiraceae bacterium]
MITVMEACESILNEFGQVAIETLIETEKGWLVSIADSKGNPYTMAPILVSNQDGVCMDAPDFFEKYQEVEIPEQFLSEKGKLKKYIMQEEHNELELNDAEKELVLNTVFDSSVINGDSADAYAIAKYFLHMVDLFCSDEEKCDCVKLIQNEMIHDFLECSFEDKIQRSHSYYFVPIYVQEYEQKTLDMLQIAREKKEGKEAEKATVSEIMSQIEEKEREVSDQIQKEASPYFNQTYITEKIKQIQESVAIENAYCLGDTEEESPRMQDMDQEQNVSDKFMSFDRYAFPSFEEMIAEEGVDHEL